MPLQLKFDRKFPKFNAEKNIQTVNCLKVFIQNKHQ